MSDMLPFYFMSAKKENLTFAPYPGLSLNYQPTDNELNPTGEGIWDEVILEFSKWNLNE